MDLQGIFRWNGFAADGQCSIGRAAGVQPGLITLRFILGAPVAQFGVLNVFYGSGYLRLSDCRVIRSVVPPGPAKMRDVSLQDRRWRWHYGTVFGAFNVQNGVRRTMREMVGDCLEAMGEVGVDVSLVPEITPPVSWEGEVAANALTQLLDSVGLQIVLGWDDRSRIVRIGEGIQAPTNDRRVAEATFTQEPPVVPEWICVQGAPIRFQRDLRLEAVGYERFATEWIRPIDELSYKPAGGWANEDPDSFMGVDAKYRDLARQTIWRTFRIVEDNEEIPGKSQFASLLKEAERAAKGSGFSPSKYVDEVFTLNDRTRILPLDGAQVSLPFFSDAKRPDRKPATVLGYFYDRKQAAKNNDDKPASIAQNSRQFPQNTTIESLTPYLIYGGGYDDPNTRGSKDGRRFTIDAQTGIVKFDEPVIYMDRDANGVASREEASLWLRTSFVLRDVQKRQPLRQQYWYRIANGVPGLVKTIDAPGLEYEFALSSGGEDKTDFQEFEREALYYCERELRRYVDPQACSLQFRGLVFDYDIDGAVRSLTLNKSANGLCTTSMEWQTERPEDRTTYEEKLKQVDQEIVSKLTRELQAAQLGKVRDKNV
jgi:hypothetical protein